MLILIFVCAILLVLSYC